MKVNEARELHMLFARLCLLLLHSAASSANKSLETAWGKPDDLLLEQHEMVLYFMHIPKSGGTHFQCLVSIDV